jgi:hypothetical protein
MSSRRLAFFLWPLLVAMLLGCSISGLLGQEAAATPTPTKTFVPTFTATPIVVATPTDTPEPTATATPMEPTIAPPPPESPTPTVGPPTSTPTPRPPAATPTPKPPAPTKTPAPVYEYDMIQAPTKDFCHPGYCIPEISGQVLDNQGNPVSRYLVTIKLNSPVHGVKYCAVGDEAKMLQPGQFKFESPDGQVFGDYTLTVVRSEGDPTALSETYSIGGSAAAKGQHTGIIFRHR